MNRMFQIQQFLKESPNDNFLIHALALEYVKEGNDAAAKKYFQQNLATSPQYIATYYHFGKLLERIGELQNAIDIYAKGMEMTKAAGDQHSYSELRSVYEELIY